MNDKVPEVSATEETFQGVTHVRMRGMEGETVDALSEDGVVSGPTARGITGWTQG